MGKAIVYCQDCGRRLDESDFDRGRASRIDNTPFCAECRPPANAPAPAPPPLSFPSPATPRRGSERVPLARPPAATPRPFKAPQPRSPLVLWVSLGFIAVVVVVGLTLALAGGAPQEKPPEIVEPPVGRKPAPPPPPEEAVDKELGLLASLLAAPVVEWKREEIEGILKRRPELTSSRRQYERGLASLNLADGLVGYWALDEKEGDVARDGSGRGRDGKVLGQPARVPGKVGGAFHFRGNGEDAVELLNVPELDLLEARSFSLSAWVKPDDVPSERPPGANDARYGIVMRQGHHSGLCLASNGRPELTYWLDGGKNVALHSPESVSPGHWTHVAGVIDVSKGLSRIFVNGRPSGENSWPPRSKVHRVRNPWRIGVALPKAKEHGWWLKGAVDEVRFHARALEPEEIVLLADGMSIPSSPPPGRPASAEGLLLHLRADAGLTLDGGAVAAWADVERNLVFRASGDERPAAGPQGPSFDGKNDRLTLAHRPDFAFGEADSFTLLARVHLPETPAKKWAGIVAKALEKGPHYGLWIDDDLRWSFSGPSNLRVGTIRAGSATLACVQVGGKERRIFVDGLRVATGPPQDGRGTGDFNLGAGKPNYQPFKGSIQEIKLWRRALDPLELR